MFFDTPVYFLFLTLVVLVYWRLSRRAQNVFLLAASYFFYGWWDWRFLILIAVSTVVDFLCALAIDRSEVPVTRRLLLALSLTINLGFLGFFKYFNFFEDSLVQLLHSLGIENVNRTFIKIALPPGISFYTFQEVAYIVDVHNRRMKPARSLVDYALFVSVFPHLIAGPIQRPSHLLPQVQRDRAFHPHRFFDGLMLIVCGLFRKRVIADNCALLATAAFSGNLGRPSLAVVAIGCYAFAWQIYGDFSGYSDIARGSAQLMGFHFMVNFRQPYLATSLQDFWRRWHISLSTWLRDYLYIPLGGNRHGEVKTYRNLLVTMLLGGLWHGANWTFVVWGGIHGAGLAAERMMRKLLQLPDRAETAQEQRRHSLFMPLAWLDRIVIFHLVCLAWIFFRAATVGGAWELVSSLSAGYWRPELLTAFEFLALFTVPLFLIDLVNEYRGEEYLLECASEPSRIVVAAVLVVALAAFSGNNLNAFIYFQF
jgi:D-alanyl-lipoteichoic acid acyltransferase DltB (MBOAT superfamily)